MTNRSPLWRLLAAIALLAFSSVPVAGQTLPADMARFPNFAADISRPTRTAVTSGLWASSATWGGIVPTGADVVIVPSGVTVTISAPAVAQAYSTVVNGTLSVNSLFVVVNLVVNPIGTLTASPGAIIRIPDVPLDLALDPAQFGHGIVVIGTARWAGTPTTDWVDLAVPPVAGATALTLGGPVVNWKAGDVLVLNDSRQVYDSAGWDFQAVGGPKRYVDQTERVIVASISGNVVQLTAPLTYAHPGGRDETGAVVLMPQVGNLTRDIVIESANPDGVRGCVRSVARADVDIQGVAFRGLGRTKATTLDNTMFNADGSVMNMGTNPIGCYAYHSHHLTGPAPSSRPYQSVFVDNVIDGSPKVGIAIHDSHYGLYKNLVITNVIGADLFLESGEETGNEFAHNFLVNAIGSEEIAADDAVSFGNLGTNIWVSDGSGTDNRFTDNVLSASRQAAMWFQVVGAPGGRRCPVGPGIDTASQFVPCDQSTQALTTFTGNRLLSHFGGISVQSSDVTIDGLKAWNIAQDWAIRVGRSGGGKQLTLKNVTVYHVDGSGRYFTAVQAEAQHFTATNFRSYGATAGGIFANQPGLSPTEGGVTFDLTDSWIQGGATALMHNLVWDRRSPSENTPTTINVTNTRLMGNRRIDVSATYQDNLNATVPYVFTVTDYEKVVGSNFRLYPELSAPTAIMPNTGDFVVPGWRTFSNMIGAPEAGLSNATSFVKYGLAFLGTVAPCSVIAAATTGAFACGTILPEPEPPPVIPASHTPLPLPSPPSSPPPPPNAAVSWTFTASTATVTAGQAVTLTITTTGTDFHNVFINGTRPTSWTCTTTGCVGTLRVAPQHTTTFQAVAITSSGGRMPSVSTTVTVNGP